ncbi:hypothetical protein [Pedobacter borealis]|uniref:hypothetical protein n=1 Tax=Pedobacter borealis TaxID=475254 RepID=UPI000AEBB407|nr:hypothetical protein [Pedobacter borealis]
MKWAYARIKTATKHQSAVPKPDCTDAVLQVIFSMFQSFKTAGGKAGLQTAMKN